CCLRGACPPRKSPRKFLGIGSRIPVSRPPPDAGPPREPSGGRGINFRGRGHFWGLLAVGDLLGVLGCGGTRSAGGAGTAVRVDAHKGALRGPLRGLTGEDRGGALKPLLMVEAVLDDPDRLLHVVGDVE